MGQDYQDIEFKRLGEVDPEAIIALMNDALVRRHLPLARGPFTPEMCEKFVAAKERMWAESGYGPWAFFIGDEFVGWGGLQPEGDDADVGMVLHPAHWGAGRTLFERIIRYASAELQVDSVIALLPPSRARVAGLLRLGFREEGEHPIGNEPFVRYRLSISRG